MTFYNYSKQNVFFHHIANQNGIFICIEYTFNCVLVSPPLGTL